MSNSPTTDRYPTFRQCRRSSSGWCWTDSGHSCSPRRTFHGCSQRTAEAIPPRLTCCMSWTVSILPLTTRRPPCWSLWTYRRRLIQLPTTYCCSGSRPTSVLAAPPSPAALVPRRSAAAREARSAFIRHDAVPVRRAAGLGTWAATLHGVRVTSRRAHQSHGTLYVVPPIPKDLSFCNAPSLSAVKRLCVQGHYRRYTNVVLALAFTVVNILRTNVFNEH